MTAEHFKIILEGKSAQFVYNCLFAIDFKKKNQNEHFRHILLYYFKKGKNVVQAHKRLCDVYGEDVLKLRQCQNWFAKFRICRHHLIKQILPQICNNV